MADFTAHDDWSEIILRADTPAARAWIRRHAGSAARGNDSFAAAPGYVLHVMLPEIRDAGLTVDGDLDENGRTIILGLRP